MGGRRLTWIAAGACVAIYLSAATLELLDVGLPFADQKPPLPCRPKSIGPASPVRWSDWPA